MEIEENGNELTELMELLPFPGNDDFAQVDDNLSTVCSSDDVAMTLDNSHSELNLV